MRWQVLNSNVPKNEAEIEEILLENRGVKTEKEREEYYEGEIGTNEKLKQLTPLGCNTLRVNSIKDIRILLDIKANDLNKVVRRIKKAIKNKEKIVIYGDYDVDGITGTAILWETLYYDLKAKCLPYIPHREDEGYGLSYKGIDSLTGNDLIITVDHGVGAKEKIDYARKKGLEVVVIDHHELSGRPPTKSGAAMVHSLKTCAAGLAWLVASELVKRPCPLELVALGVIADLAPLTGVNRIFARQGLREINKTKRLGLLSLIKESELMLGQIGTYEIGYMLAPRLNAAGRLVHALDSLRLLFAKDEKEAMELARKLSDINRERQDITKENWQHARGMIETSAEKLLFVAHESYNAGVIGLVAGKLTEEFYRPAIVIAQGKEISKGSCRSIKGFDIAETLRSCQELLIDGGGHQMAGGFTVETEKITLLRTKLMAIAEEQLDEEKLTKTLKIDMEIPLEMVNQGLYEKIQKMSPFGMGNPEPIFATREVIIQDARAMGAENKHLRLRVGRENEVNRPARAAAAARADIATVEAVGFGLGHLAGQLRSGQKISLAYSLSLNNWNNQKRLQLKVKDVKVEKQF